MLVNLKTTIAARRLRQCDLAERVGISAGLLSQIVHERRHADTALRARIVEALDADETWLFSSIAEVPRRGVSPG